ncbi:MAG: ATP-dependent metallopeptidase FtsH/Yme1/Tma family protein, partial [Tepidisphaeraceae bacterium]
MADQTPEKPPTRRSGRSPAGNGGMRFGRGLFGWVLFIGLAVMLFMLLNHKQKQFTPIALSDFKNALVDKKVAKLTIEGDDVTGEFKVKEPLGPQQQPISHFRTPFPTNTSTDFNYTKWIIES